MKVCLAVLGLAVIVIQGRALASAVSADRAATTPAPGIVERFLRSAEPRLVSFRGVRHLEASTSGGRMSATLDAWTELGRDGMFRFEVVKETGSALIRRHVLVAALVAEERHRNQHETAAVEFTPANYDFLAGPGSAPGQLTLALSPKRESPMLINGHAIIAATDADLLRVEGRLAAAPSFWTPEVDIVCRYTRIAGVRVPVELRSRSTVRVAGEASFLMTYGYTTLNGTVVEPRR